MKWILVLPVLVIPLFLAGCATSRHEGIAIESPETFLERAVVGPQGDGTYVVATTQIIDPAGESILFPGRPTDLALSPGGDLLVIKTTGRSRGKSLGELVFIDCRSKQAVQFLALPSGNNNFCGIHFSNDGQTIWTTEAAGSLHTAIRQADGLFAWAESIALPGPAGKGDAAPGGLALDEARGRIYVTLSRNNTLAVVNPATKAVEQEIPVGIAPYTVVSLGDKAYVSNWGGRRPREGDVTGPTSGSRAVVDPKTGIASTGSISVVDLEARKVIKEIETGLHPSGMAFSPDSRRLYVANANSDTVSVIRTDTDIVEAVLDVKPMKELPFGSAPNALTVSPDGATLYVANGGNN